MKKKVALIIVISVFIILGGVFTLIYLNNNDNDDEILSLMDEDYIQSEKLDEEKLTFYFLASEPKDTREVLDQIEIKAKNKLNIKLDFKFIYQNPETYLSNIKTLISSGQDCDAFYYSQQFPQNLKILAGENLIKDISDEFPKYAPSYFSKFSKEEIRAASSDNKIYFIPNRLPTSQMRCALVRTDFMEKYNIPEINSYDDYEVYLKTIKEKEPDMFPMLFNETAIGLFAEANGYIILDYVQGLVYKFDDPDMKIVAWEQTPEFKKSILTINKWYDSGYMLKGIGASQIDETIITSDKWGSFITGLGSEFGFNSLLKANNKSWSYKACLLYPDKPSARNSPVDGAMLINAKSDNSKRVLMFLEWLQLNQENYDSLMYGIEGKHYILDGDRITLPEGVKQSESCLSWGWRWPFQNIDYERADLSTSDEAVKTYYKIIKEKTKYPPHMGFVPDYGSVTEITTGRQLSFYTTEQSIYGGFFKPEKIDEYIKEGKDGGVDKLVGEVQKQLDKWRTETR